MEKRKWHYLASPSSFDMAPCACGNHDTQWSEFAKHLWCEPCQIDFIPEHAGIFDGPIGITTSTLLGYDFRIFNMLTQQVEDFDAQVAARYHLRAQSPLS